MLINAVPLLEGFQLAAHRADLANARCSASCVMGSTTRWLLARSLRQGATNPDAWTRRSVRTVWEQFDQGTQRAILRLYRSAPEDRLAQAGAHLDTLTMPGARGLGRAGPMARGRVRRGVRRALPNATLHKVPDAGHWPWLDERAGDRRRRGLPEPEMSVAVETKPQRAPRRLNVDWKRASPTLIAAVLATVYVIVSPPSLDLAAHLLRAKLFRAEGFGLWNNWWYGGHHVLGYSVLFPPIAALLTPQLAAAIAATATAALFESLARRHFGRDAWLGATVVRRGDRDEPVHRAGSRSRSACCRRSGRCSRSSAGARGLAAALAVVTALASPVAALFAALAGAAYAIGSYIEQRSVRSALPGHRRRRRGLAPVLALSVAFPEGGSEPFTFATLAPEVAVALIALAAIPKGEHTLRAGDRCCTRSAASSPTRCRRRSAATRRGSARSSPARSRRSCGGRGADSCCWRRRSRCSTSSGRRRSATSTSRPTTRPCWRPTTSRCSRYLDRQPGPPFRVEIPFTQVPLGGVRGGAAVPARARLGAPARHQVQPPLLRRRRALTPATYKAWLHQLAVRYVAVSDARLDYSAKRETALINRGLPYLQLALRTRHWRVYAVSDPTPIVQGAATLEKLGPNSLTLNVHRPGTVFVRVRFTPYWAVDSGVGMRRARRRLHATRAEDGRARSGW